MVSENILKIPTQVLTPDNALYPQQLLDLEDPPEELHIRGTFDPTIFATSLSVVGSRKMTAYGAQTVDFIIPPLVKSDVSIISGFMYGIDTRAHHKTLSAGGKTIAILGNGLNYLYPAENRQLYEDILSNGGCVISEYPDDFEPQTWTFPKRNRIVASLGGLGTLVIEAGEMSGSLITAAYADALNRPLYVVPGSIFSLSSKGANQLIKDSLAKVVTSANDILKK